MIIKCIYIPLLICAFLSQPIVAAETEWTEKKLEKASDRAERAAAKKKWSLVIKYGQQVLEASEALNKSTDESYINSLKNLNRAYDKVGRLHDASPTLEKAYLLSKKHLGLSHPTTIVSRTLYYKLFVSQKQFAAAIPLVLESISILGNGTDDAITRHQYLKQLYSLYGLTAQLAKEEETLLLFLELDKRLYDTPDEDNKKIIQNLANNYCRQKKYAEFNALVADHKLQFICE